MMVVVIMMMVVRVTSTRTAKAQNVKHRRTVGLQCIHLSCRLLWDVDIR